MTLAELKLLLSRFHLRPDKRLGQNFLLSDKALDEIVAAAELVATDRVLEIGPGLGALTRRLADQAGEIVAIEKDWKLVRVLRKTLKRYKNVKVIQGDALFVAPTTYQLQPGNYKLVANIPYYLTGKILQNLFEIWPRPAAAVLLVQKGVAERLAAPPGALSVLGVTTQFYADVKIIQEVPRTDFYPVPEVDSAIVRLEVLPQPRFAVDKQRFFQLVKIGFSNKRKQLHNNLQALAKRDYKPLLEALGLNSLARAQDLSLQDWRRLYEKLFET